MAFQQTRTPNQARRTGRNFERFASDDVIVDPNGAININPTGQIELLIASGEPFAQTSLGLTFEIVAAGGLEVVSSEIQIHLDPAGEDFLVLSSSGLDVDEGVLYSFAAYYG